MGCTGGLLAQNLFGEDKDPCQHGPPLAWIVLLSLYTCTVKPGARLASVEVWRVTIFWLRTCVGQTCRPQLMLKYLKYLKIASEKGAILFRFKEDLFFWNIFVWAMLSELLRWWLVGLWDIIRLNWVKTEVCKICTLFKFLCMIWPFALFCW